MEAIHLAMIAAALAISAVQIALTQGTGTSLAPRRWFANILLYVTVIATVTLFAGALAYLTRADAVPRMAGLLITNLPLAVQGTIVLLAHSLVQYWVHRAAHHLPHLWKLHRVHHADPVLDATTGLRHHPLESVLDYAALSLPVLIFAPVPEAVFGVLLFSMAMALFSHLDPALVPARVDRALSIVLMTPRLHRLHHSTWQPETDTNFGGVLVIWDRLFRTFLPAPETIRPNFSLGLLEIPATSAHDPFVMLAAPFLPNDLRKGDN